jgi:hypothetical protein
MAMKSINFKDMVLGDHKDYGNDLLNLASIISCGIWVQILSVRN